MNPQLVTPRCLLRAPQPGDAEPAWARWGQDAPVWRFLAWPQPPQARTLGQQLDYAGALWRKHAGWTWVLCLAPHPQEPIGLLQLLPPDPRPVAPPQHPHHLRLGYLLARPWQGQGLMREAVGAVLAHALHQPGVWRVDALCDVDNTASARLLTALGLVREGLLRRHSLHPGCGPGPRDVWLFAAIRSQAHSA